MLSFALDKRNYEVGDMATVYLPRSSGGRVLLSVENGSRVLSRRWVRLSGKEETASKLQVTKDMAPNFYVHATLLQPHAQTVNDLPIRMYGVEGAEVIDRRTILHPQIEVADEILPQREFAIRIHERDNKPMSYTLAIVDEGLLDITAFRTPQPWQAMNRREALGVRTWDMYDDVIGAYAGKFTSILSVGGDEAIREAAGKEKRFNPVVKFLGPFTLNGGTKTHRITLPMYVGSVRVMVVAAHAGSYGSADKTVTVRSPLMLLPTLPRVLACGDRVRLPVNLFASDEALGDIQVNIETEGPVSVVGGRSRTLHFASAGEKMVDFELLCDRQKKRAGENPHFGTGRRAFGERKTRHRGAESAAAGYNGRKPKRAGRCKRPVFMAGAGGWERPHGDRNDTVHPVQRRLLLCGRLRALLHRTALGEGHVSALCPAFPARERATSG